jgi:uncharacterized protein YgbK (DUF1537 family)
MAGIELGVRRVLGTSEKRDAEIDRVRLRAAEVLGSGGTAVVFTSRTVAKPEGRDELTVARTVSDALAAVVREIDSRPAYVIGKGGITSSDIGTRGLGAERALVLGQIRPGVPVWRLGAESRFPGLPYVVFPGNVGAPNTLAKIVAELVGGDGAGR